jgi:hypothetical protein
MPQPGNPWFRRRRAAHLSKPARWLRPCIIDRGREGRRLDALVDEVRVVRKELVARVRREISAGTYDTPAKLEEAFERLLMGSA